LIVWGFSSQNITLTLEVRGLGHRAIGNLNEASFSPVFLLLSNIALKKAAETRKPIDQATGKRRTVAVSVIEAFGGGGVLSGDTDAIVPVKDLEEVLRLEYRGKLLNPKWRDAMLKQGSGGAYEISQRMTAMVGWAATAEVDNFVFDQAADRYTNDAEVAQQLQRSNPEAFKNVVRRLLEAAGRGMWEADDKTLRRLRDLYSDADDLIEKRSG
jgi:magnesium chelatase subunit H